MGTIGRYRPAGWICVLLAIPGLSPAAPRGTWAIGTDDTHPYHYLTAHGADGMAAAIVTEAARRAGVELEWKAAAAGPKTSLESRAVDLWPLVTTTMSASVHYTKPYLRNEYVLMALDERLVRGPPGRAFTASVLHYPFVADYARRSIPGVLTVLAPTREEALAAVCEGRAQAAFLDARTAQYLMLSRPRGCEGKIFHTAGVDTPARELAIASTLEAAPVADRLRAEIDRMMADGSIRRVLRPWGYYYSGEAELIREEAHAGSAERRSVALAGVLAVLSALLLVLLLRVRRAQQAAVAANAAKTRFLANMSHELRTPLNGILGVGQWLESTPLAESQRHFVQILLGSGRALLAIVNDLLDLSRIEQRRFELEQRPADPAALIVETVRAFEIAAGEKGLALVWRGLEGLPPAVMVDAARFRQILSNLVANAIKFTPRGAVTVEVRCEARPASAKLELTVADTGIGIPAEAQERLFERFYQVDTTISRRFGGTGLGLAIAKELVEAMGGRIAVESAPGQGSKFSIWLELPLAEAPAAAAEPERNAEIAGNAEILLVEDNQINEVVARRLLERAGYRVTSVGDGEAALRECGARHFDAILMDCQMPVMDGFEAAAELRRRENGGRRTPIIALTAAAMSGERERCVAAGMDDYLTKPIDLAELDRVLKSWVQPGADFGTDNSPLI